ncbi:MAG: exodeoxyribonuclease VII large subunit [Desulfobacterota bacterium]|nr:exodeoxyribonuclease VII large subunit [Thermodesulfobacteriota bacterium]MDW8002596.1 exodeoxyribonuclease VII large subunit [Deltaproteobacteria bacterium]
MAFFWPTRIYTVSELTYEIRKLITSELKDVLVEGEISNLRLYPSGHLYFSLKDQNSVIKCVMFNFLDRYFGEELKDGISVILRGRVDVYEKRGEYQFVVEDVEPRGIGLLALKFELLKRKLKQEGMFDAKWKKRIPLLPEKVGIITSPHGAAIRDMLKIIDRKFCNMHVLIYPVRVQGDESANEIIEGLEYFNRVKEVDVIILARGGGSLEDLAPFNDERLARTIFASKIPVVTGIGHEIDFTIADFVSDLRAPTPTAAADSVVPDKGLLKENLKSLKQRLKRGMELFLEKAKASLLCLFMELRENKVFFERQKIYLDELSNALSVAISEYIKEKRDKLLSFSIRLESLNPESVLRRGYSIAIKKETGKVIKDVDQVALDEEIYVRLHKGKLLCAVQDKSN